MSARAAIGDRIPQVTLGRLVGGEVNSVSLDELVAGKRAVMVGIPGAFTPICTCAHIPDFVGRADRLRSAGFELIICVAPNDPWTTDAWAACLDPDDKVLFLSDGNLALARGLGANITDHKNFLGERSTRYLMVVESGVIRRLTIEPHPMALTCTRTEDVLFLG